MPSTVLPLTPPHQDHMTTSTSPGCASRYSRVTAAQETSPAVPRSSLTSWNSGNW